MSEHDVDLVQLAKAVEGVNTGFEEFKAANEARLKEIEAKGGPDPLTEEKLAKLNAELTSHQEKIDEAILAAKRRSRVMVDADGNEIDLDKKARDFGRELEWATKRAPADFDAARMAEYKSAFNRLLRVNFERDMLTDAERKTLSEGVDSAGGYYVHPDMTGRTVQKVYETSPVRAYASVQSISGPSHEGYYDNDEVGFGWVAELESRPATSTPATGKWSIPVHEMYAMPEASQTILDDASVDLEQWLSGKIADKFARAENAAFVSGNGVDKPRGFLNYPDGTDLTNSITRFKTGVNGDFAAAPAGIDKLISVQGDLKAAYRGNANWFMNRTVEAQVRLLKDSDGRHLWQPSIAADRPATLLGRGVAIFEDMPNLAPGSLSIAYGDMRQAYQIVDRIGIRMLRDPFSAKPKIQFYATKRTGGDMINGEALKLLEFSA